LDLNRSAQYPLGEANCARMLGAIALASDHTQARQYFEAATSIYQRIGRADGEALCRDGLQELERMRDY
jgi:hypothetical protein